MSLRAAVIGFGSIGSRHARVLEGLGVAVSVVSRRGEGGHLPAFTSFAQARAKGPFGYVVITDETARHIETLSEVAASGHDGLVLVEKPLFAAPAAIPARRFHRGGVGYNLRFDPAVQALRADLAGRRTQAADFRVGQWLGDWRPGRDVALTYSASHAAGGGALRDLSHELDLACWLFGAWIAVAASGGRLGSVTVDADDAWSILLSCERCPLVTIHMNCLDRIGRRTVTVQSDGETFDLDMVAGTIRTGASRREFAADRDASFAAMHQALMRGSDDVCTLDEGAAVVELIAAVERASAERRWVTRASR